MQNHDQCSRPAHGEPCEQREQQGFDVDDVVQEQQHKQQPEQQLQQREEELFRLFRESQIAAVDLPSQTFIQNPKP